MTDVLTAKNTYCPSDSFGPLGGVNLCEDHHLSNDSKFSSNDNSKGNTTLTDEYWLFKPQNFKQNADSIVPLDIWLRAIFDSPDSCFFQSRRNLLTRLETILLTSGPVDANRRSGSVPSLNEFSNGLTTQHQYQTNDSLLSSANSSDNLFCNNQTSVVVYEKSAHYAKVGTFTRVKRAKQCLPPQFSLAQRQIHDTQESNLLTGGHFSGKQVTKTGSYDELETISKKANVQEIARIQEDNLKAEVAALAAAAAERHGSQHSIASLSRNGSHTNIASAPESPHSSTTKLAKVSVISGVPSEHCSDANYMYSQPVLQACNNVREHTVSSHLKHHAYSLLPQKPVVPVMNTDSSDIRLHNNNGVSIPQFESRNHFGFRSSTSSSSSRKCSFPVQAGVNTFKRASNAQFTTYPNKQ